MERISLAATANCFKKAKILDKDQTIAIKDEDDPFKEINEDLQELREKDSSLVPESMTAEDLASADDAVITRESTLTDEEILEEATKIDDDGVEDIEDEDDEELVAPGARDVEKSLEILKAFLYLVNKEVARSKILYIRPYLLEKKLKNVNKYL